MRKLNSIDFCLKHFNILNIEDLYFDIYNKHDIIYRDSNSIPEIFDNLALVSISIKNEPISAKCLFIDIKTFEKYNISIKGEKEYPGSICVSIKEYDSSSDSSSDSDSDSYNSEDYFSDGYPRHCK